MATRKKTAEKKNEVARPKNTAVTAPERDYSRFGNDTGFENQTQDDQSVPLLIVLQSNSPQCKRDGIAGAQEGMIFNTATEELYDGEEGVVFVPATTEHVFIEYRPREQNGGFVGIHTPESQVVVDAKARSTKFGDYKTPEGNELVETFQIYCVLCDEESQEVLGFAVIPCASTKIKPYKAFNNRLRSTMVMENGRRMPARMFANLYRMTTWQDHNANGEFMNVAFAPAVNGDKYESLLDADDPRMEAGFDFMQLVNSGEKKAAQAPREAGSDRASTGEGSGSGETTDGDPPF
jgi:hypothetical protein